MNSSSQAGSARDCGPVKAVVLDWAGTTLDHGSCAPVVAFIEAFRLAGVEITAYEARLPMGSAKLDHIRQILAMPAVIDRWQTARGVAPTDADAREIYDRFLPVQLQCLARHATLIPGALELQQYCREHKIRMGSSTGYVRELMDVLIPLANEQGFAPEAMACASDVPIGRPAPWMNLENLRQLNVYPVYCAVAVDDTVVGVQAGVNAGMWSIGVTRTGNELGLSETEVAALPPAELAERLSTAKARLQAAGAHYVLESIAELPAVLTEISSRLSQGERPG